MKPTNGRFHRLENKMRRGRAFTLIEVLVSLAMFSVAAVVLGTAYVNVLLNYHNMQRKMGGKSEIAFVRATVLSEPNRARLEEGGEVPLAEGGRLRWDVTIEETEIADLFQVKLDLEISPEAPSPAQRRNQAFFLLRPTWSEPEQRERLREAARKRLGRLRS